MGGLVVIGRPVYAERRCGGRDGTTTRPRGSPGSLADGSLADGSLADGDCARGATVPAG
jgi:hypothetical protein